MIPTQWLMHTLYDRVHCKEPGRPCGVGSNLCKLRRNNWQLDRNVMLAEALIMLDRLILEVDVSWCDWQAQTCLSFQLGVFFYTTDNLEWNRAMGWSKTTYLISNLLMLAFKNFLVNITVWLRPVHFLMCTTYRLIEPIHAFCCGIM